MKYCPSHPNPDGTSGADLPEEAFYPDPKRPGGLAGQCRECKKARNRRYWKERYYPAHREEQIAASTANREARRATRVLYHGKGDPRPGTIVRRLSLGANGLVRVKLDDDHSVREAVSEETARERKGRAYWTAL